MDKHEEPSYALEIDLEDMGCGDMLIALMKALRCIRSGEVLKARDFDTGAEADIPAWFNLRRHS
jgi:tRNA 2-thiouridine synthesizing protein A